MVRAIWNGEVIAEADKGDCEDVEGNIYFPPDSIKKEFFEKSDHNTTCPWKGEASYYHLKVNGETNENAAWVYPDPKEAASNIRGFVAFWKGVEVEE